MQFPRWFRKGSYVVANSTYPTISRNPEYTVLTNLIKKREGGGEL
jgi:hypothetical protein